jgi:hypothetical protein
LQYSLDQIGSGAFTTSSEKNSMYRAIAALLFLVASAATASAQGLLPTVWKSQTGAILKVLRVDAGGNFSGVFLSSPSGPCPAVPYDVAGRIRTPRVAFQTTRSWTADCRVTAVWSGRLLNPTTLSASFVATRVAPNGRVAKTRGREIFQRI